MTRRVEPELLDELPPSDPRAIESRRDLQRFNRLMGHAGVIARALSGAAGPGALLRLVELGCGDGTLLLQVARRLSNDGYRASLVLIDRQPAVSGETLSDFRALGWKTETVTADAFDWLVAGNEAPGTAMLANLFLHHFEDGRLRALLRLAAARCEWFVACEPRRCGLARVAGWLTGLFGSCAVTRHDARVSVRAGFAGREISEAWPEGAAWHCEERAAGAFSHFFLARRRAA